jgi:hypothetical protein
MILLENITRVKRGVHFTLGASFAGRINSLQPQRETDLCRFPPSRRRATWGRGSRKFICPYPICPKTEMHPKRVENPTLPLKVV